MSTTVRPISPKLPRQATRRPTSADMVHDDSTNATTTPWYAWCAALAILSAVIGGHWDISWHMSIGRDTFWTPAHMAIYLCGILGGLISGYLIFGTTFHFLADFENAAVNVFGFRGPLGAFIMGWGGGAMLTSAPFDNWWHDAYGLDVKILSPPHVILMLGIFGVGFGALLLLLGLRNRSAGVMQTRYDRLVVGLVLAMIQLAVLEYTLLPYQHTALCYVVLAITVPLYLWISAEISSSPWACTSSAAVYTILNLAMLWILPRFAAEPKLGPVYQPVTQFIPAAGFPLLIIVPAIACDLVRRHLTGRPIWLRAGVLGSVFMGALIAAQWPFATFLQTPVTRNAIFGTGYYPYYAGPNTYSVRHIFAQFETTPRQFWTRIALAFAISILMTAFGMARGAWMRRVQR